jgi:CheY-like chemotaxis protein
MIFILLIEDDSKRADRFKNLAPPGIRIVHARTAGLAIGILRRDRFKAIILDHDLSKSGITAQDNSLSGSDLVEIIVTSQKRGLPILIHTISREGGPLMAKRLTAEGFDVMRCPYPELSDEVIKKWFQEIIEIEN